MSSNRIVPLFLLLAQASFPNIETPASDLEFHLELAKRDQAYVLVADELVRVGFKGREVKRFLVEDSEGLGNDKSRLAQLQERIPSPIVKLVEVPEGPDDKVGSIGSLEDRVGVRDMPDNYYLILDDGTHWLVVSGDWREPDSAFERWVVRARASFSYLAGWPEHRQSSFIVTRLSSEAAQDLYWIIQEGTGVFYQ